jgi:predicted metallopeptidase
MRLLAADLIERLPELSHIRLAQVAISFRQTRKAVKHGIQATLTPLRFEQGSLITVRRRRTWTIERLHGSDGQEFLYLLNFYLPRFQNLPRREKLVTILHELWHIGPAFDGDLRRHPGRCYAHSRSQRDYDAAMEPLAEAWLQINDSSQFDDLLDLNFRQLRATHGGVYGTCIRTPRLVLVPA